MRRVAKQGKAYAKSSCSGYSKEGVTKLNPLGKFPEDWVTHIPYLRGKELLGYPTQKPLALYERIIKASSNRGDLVLDPFCGCGTTIDAALKNGRRAIGIDILPFALRLINARREGINLPVQGVPVDKKPHSSSAKTIRLSSKTGRSH